MLLLVDIASITAVFRDDVTGTALTNSLQIEGLGAFYTGLRKLGNTQRITESVVTVESRNEHDPTSMAPTTNVGLTRNAIKTTLNVE